MYLDSNMNRLVKNPRFRQWVRNEFRRSFRIRAIPYNYAVLAFEFITVEEREKYQEHLSFAAHVKLEYFGQFFKYAERYGYVDDQPAFNDLMVLNLQKVFGDPRITPAERVQVIYATGNLAYMVNMLEEMVDEVQ